MPPSVEAPTDLPEAPRASPPPAAIGPSALPPPAAPGHSSRIPHPAPVEPLETSWRMGQNAPRDDVEAVYLGKQAETPYRNVWLDTRGAHVLYVMGKRRSGKSYTLGVLAEGLGAQGWINQGAFAQGILILDTIGELGRVYGVGRISFVGGSLVPVGGHNLLEPASFGCPVLFGPHTHNFVLMSQLLVESGGGIRIKNGEELFIAVKTLLNNPDRSASMGKAAKAYVAMNKGALERVMSYITGCI